MSDRTPADILTAAPYYRITLSTGVVHSVPCIRMPIESSATREWLPYTLHERLCRHCLPDGTLELPKRVQRKRTRGWRMPDGAVYVGRPTRWGNPFPIAPGARGVAKERSAERATAAFRVFVASTDLRRQLSYPNIPFIRMHLAGKDLACWCPLDGPCHADVLLEMANGGAA